MRLLKRLPTATDTPADIIAVATGVGIMAMATAIGLITAMATATGHTVITATAGDQASPSVSDEAGAGATNATHDGGRLKGRSPGAIDDTGASGREDGCGSGASDKSYARLCCNAVTKEKGAGEPTPCCLIMTAPSLTTSW